MRSEIQRTEVRRDGPATVIEAYADDAPARPGRHDGPLVFTLAIIAAFVIAAVVAIALEPAGDVHVAAVADRQPARTAGPCDNQTWPHFTPTCLASKRGRQAAP